LKDPLLPAVLAILVLTFFNIYDTPHPQWKSYLLQMLYKELWDCLAMPYDHQL